MTFNILKYHFVLSSLLLFYSATLFGQQTFFDQFNVVNYNNSNGTEDWSGNFWIENNDGGNAPNNGSIRIISGRLRFLNSDNDWIYRFVPLAGASSVQLSLDFDGISRGGEIIDVFIYNSNTTVWNLVGSIDSNTTGSITYNLTADEIASNPAIIFFPRDTDWQSGDTIFIDNVLFTAFYDPVIQVNDISVDETAGVVNLTVTHTDNSSSGFSVDFQTVDQTALAGSDYTFTNGTLNFSGTVGDTETITVPINNDVIIEDDETFRIEFTASSNPNVDFTDTATVTINSQIPFNQPLSLYEQFAGYVDYTSTGGTFRTASNSVDWCSISTTSSGALLSTIPATASIKKAYLYWAHSSYVIDNAITFEGQNVISNLIYESGIAINGINRTFFGYVSDVTDIIEGIGVANLPTTTFDVTGLTIDTSANYCDTGTVLGGWSLMIFYEDASKPAANINLYLGFDGLSNQGTSFTLDAFYAIAGTGSKASFLSWEGDDTLDGSSDGSTNPEELSITNQAGTTFVLSGDGGNPGNNAYNSSAYDNTQTPIVNISTLYGVDWDTFNISSFISPTDTQVTANVDVGQDFVVSNAVVLKVPSNLVTGYVFEDINYPGGVGRNRTNANGLPVVNATLELYNATNTLITTTTTDANGQYTFGGMPDGTYSIRVVNSSVRSNRGGGNACASCLPVQTFRSFNTGAGMVEVTNEIGGASPAQEDSGAGSLTGAQSVSQVTLASNGVVGIDFGFNFNTIVNTNVNGQGSLQQFIVNANNLDETGLDVEANTIFDPAAGDDTSIFMIPTSTDPLGRTVDANYANGYFNILITNGSPLPNITGNNTKIDGRTQTAYSGDTNAGNIGLGGSVVGTLAANLPFYDLPEIQINRNNGDVLVTNGNNLQIRNVSVFANNNSGIRVEGGSMAIQANLLGVNALGVNAGGIDTAVEMVGGTLLIEGNYIATNTNNGININGGSSTIVQLNHITSNGGSACDENIRITGGSGIVIQQNLIENAASLGIDAASSSGNLVITENTITGSGRISGNCGGSPENMGIELGGSNSQITLNVIHSNGGAGIATTGSGAGNLISQNSFYSNGTVVPALGIDLGGNGVTLNDTGDADTGSNNLLNFPIIKTAYILSNTIVVNGWAPTGSTLEFFLTDINENAANAGDNQLGLTQDYGEGQIFLASEVEGGVSDQNNTTSFYIDADGNTDTTSFFQFSIPLPLGTNIGELITATATLANSTSEFSPMSQLKLPTLITNRRITYRVNKN